MNKFNIKLTDNALKVLRSRALRNNHAGEEKPEEAFWRVARVVAGAERFYGKHESEVEEIAKDFFEVQNRLEFLSGRPLARAGSLDKTMSQCFVLPIEDSIDSIFGTLKDNIKILQMGGGTGFNFSHLRSRDELVGSIGEPAAGPVYFLKVYSYANKVMRDRGGRLMGAMAILNADHPDIESFIELKVNEPWITNFNISVGSSDKFMNRVEKKGDWELVDPHTGQVRKRIAAEELFDKIVHTAWTTGDPGLFFLDTTEKTNPTPQLGRMESTNPCGEQPLLAYEACNLGSITISRFVEKKHLDFDRLETVVRTAVRFLDNVIDVNNYPLQRNDEICKGNRKIGLGLMGFADLLIRLGIPYDSLEAEKIAEEVMSFITGTGRDESVNLAKQKGSYPNFSLSIWSEQGFKKLRNASITTIAPTGTISLIAGCSPGIEPIFALGFKHKNVMKKDAELVEVNSLFKQVAKENGFYSEELIERVAETGSVQGIKAVPEKYQRLFKTSHEIEPEWHVRIQAAFQKYTDNAVSKTINLPHSATVDDVKNAYILSWKLGCKGTTVYRDRCKNIQVMNVGVK